MSRFLESTLVVAVLAGGAVSVVAAAGDDPVRQRLAGVCTVVGDSECYRIFPEQFPARVRVTLRNGTSVEEHVMANRGGAEWPLTGDELKVKLEQTAGDRADAIVATMNELGGAADVSALLRATWGMRA